MLTPKNIQLDMLITKDILMVMFLPKYYSNGYVYEQKYSVIFMINAIKTVTYIPKYYSNEYTM